MDHPKNLHLPGALVLLRIFAPEIEDCPMKKALYAEAVEKLTVNYNIMSGSFDVRLILFILFDFRN